MITSILFLFTAAVASPVDCDFALGRASSTRGRDEIVRGLQGLGLGQSVDWISPDWVTLPRGGGPADYVPAFATLLLVDHLAANGFSARLHLTRGRHPAAGDPGYGFSSKRWFDLPAPHLRTAHVPYLHVTAD